MSTATNEPFSPTGTSGQLQIGGVDVVSSASVTSLVRTDWQGDITLSTSARTSYADYSATVGSYSSSFNSGTGSVAVITTGQTAPDGTTNASRIQLNQGSGSSGSDYSGIYASGSSGHSSGVTATYSIWMKSNTGGNQSVILWPPGMPGGGLVTVTTTWQKFSITGTSNATSGSTMLSIGWGTTPANTTSDILIAYPEWELGSSTQSFIPNSGTTHSPITDYSYTSSGAVTLGQTASGTYVWSGSGTLAADNGAVVVQPPQQQDGGGGGVHKKQGVTAGAGLRVPYRHEKPVDEFGYEINEPSVPPTPLPKVSAPREAPIPTGPTALDLAIAPPYREPVANTKDLPTLQIKSGPTPDEVMKVKHNHALRLLLLAS